MAKRRKVDFSKDSQEIEPTGEELFSGVARDLGFRSTSGNKDKGAKISEKKSKAGTSLNTLFREDDLRGLKASLRIERKGRKGKTVTLVTGLDLNQIALGIVVKQLKKALGCGASIEKDSVVVLQGDNRDRIALWLKTRGVRVSG